MNIVDLQDDIFNCLLSWDMVDNINIVQQRKMRLQNMADFATIYHTARNGDVGIGILVEMPTFKMSNNLSGPGPQTELLVSLLVVECPPINLQDTGTGTDAESVAELLLPFMHQWLIDGQGEMYPQDTPIAPANDLPEGCLGYRVSVKMQHAPDTSLARVPLPAQTIDGSLNVTLADTSGKDADVYYTLDESTPCAANSVATKYVGSFPTKAGDVVRWQAWVEGMLPSTIGSATINP